MRCRRYSQGREHGARTGKCVREGGPISQRPDKGNPGATGQVGNSFWPRTYDGSEADPLSPAHSEDALPEAARSTDDGHVMW